MPKITLPVAPAPPITMPEEALPEMMFRSEALVPPMVLLAPSTKMPLSVLVSPAPASTPVASMRPM